MRPFFSTLVFATAFVLCANAQNFRPGYYIPASGDTVKGDILLKKKGDKLVSVDTKEGLSLRPRQLQGVGQNEVDYVVRRVTMDKSPGNGSVTDTVFLEVMSRGKMSLYYTVDENDKSHFYLENENGINELGVKIVNTQEAVQSQRIDIYKGTLKGLFPECTDLFPAIQKTAFSKKGIQSIYEKLYNCRYNEQPSVVANQNDGLELVFGIQAGVSSSKIAVSNEGKTPFASRLNYADRSVDPTFGFFLEIKDSHRNSFALRQELTYMQYEFNPPEYQPDPSLTVSYKASTSAAYLKYTIAARMYFLRGPLRPFLSVGLSPAYATSLKHTLERIKSVTPGTTPLFSKVSKFELATLASGGVMYKGLQLDIRYELSNGFNPSGVDLKVKTLYFTLSCQLNKRKQ